VTRSASRPTLKAEHAGVGVKPAKDASPDATDGMVWGGGASCGAVPPACAQWPLRRRFLP